MTYQQTLDYLFEKLPMYSRIGAAAYKEDLDNTIQLCNTLGNPHTSFKTIHVAGTNGKGSVSHMLAAVLQTAGYKTGLYTSPHLKDFRERIKINGEMIPESFVIDFTKRIQLQIETIEPSFFEITVAMAFDYFAKEKVDIAIIEVGLGGRLDSTNIITPEVAVITNIGFDHMNMLGNTLAKIAFEKAGIIKPGIPVVIGETLPETLPVFEQKAKEVNAPLYLAAQHRQALNWKWEHHELVVEVADKHSSDHHVYQLDLPGIYQTKNVLAVLQTCTLLQQKGWKINDAVIHEALKNTKKLTGLHGRWEIIHHSPTVVLDVAHNEAGIYQLLEQIEVTDYHQLHLITGFVKDKEVDTILSLLPKTANYYFTQAHISRALDADSLQATAINYNIQGKIYSNVNDALKEAKTKATKNDLIVVFGSVFLVAEVIH